MYLRESVGVFLQWTPPYGHLGNTVTSFLRPISFVPEKEPYIFSKKKTRLCGHPSVIRSHFKIPNSRFLYNFTPLIRPLELNVENQSACDMSILSTIVIYLLVKQPICFTTRLQFKQSFSLFSFLMLTSTWANCRAIKSLCFHHKINLCTKACLPVRKLQCLAFSSRGLLLGCCAPRFCEWIFKWLFIEQIIQGEKDSSCPWSANVIYLSLPSFSRGFWPYPVNKATSLILAI